MTTKSIRALVMGLAFISLSAKADIEFCNKTGETIYTAIAYFDGGCGRGEYDSKGWIRLTAYECTTVYRGKTEGRRFYYYASNESRNRFWGGGETFRVSKVDSFHAHDAKKYCSTDCTRGFRAYDATHCDDTVNFTYSASRCP